MIRFKLNYKNILRYNPLIAINTVGVFLYLYYTKIPSRDLQTAGLMAAVSMCATGIAAGMLLILDFFSQGKWYNVSKYADRNSKIATAIYTIPFIIMAFHFLLGQMRSWNQEEIEDILAQTVKDIKNIPRSQKVMSIRNSELDYFISFNKIDIYIIVNPERGIADIRTLHKSDEKIPKKIKDILSILKSKLKEQGYTLQNELQPGFM